MKARKVKRVTYGTLVRTMEAPHWWGNRVGVVVNTRMTRLWDSTGLDSASKVVPSAQVAIGDDTIWCQTANLEVLS